MNQIQHSHFDLPPIPPKGGLKKMKLLLIKYKFKSMNVFKVPLGGFRGKNSGK
jgi:hypothetical protein